MNEIPPHVYAAVKMVTERLNDVELNAICLVALLGTDPRHVAGYDRAAPLFTEAHGTKMHAVGVDALVLIRDERLEKAVSE